MMRWAWLLPLFLVAPAGAAPPAFTAPGPSQVLTWMPVDAALQFDAAANDSSLQVTFNGVDVTPAFSVGPPQGGLRIATGTDVWGEFVVHGSNVLRAWIDAPGGAQQASVRFTLVGDPYADEVSALVLGTQGGFNSTTPGVVLGAPQGDGLFQGSLDVVSLGLGGEIVVAFTDNRIVDGDGPDFSVFENSFLEIGAGGITDPPFAEPGLVSVSQDGESWVDFDACPIDNDSSGPYWPGCAGIYPALSDGTPITPHASVLSTTPLEDLVGVSFLTLAPPTGTAPPGAGGDSFDLADVGLPWARYVRVLAADFATGPVGPNNAGFDLDGVAAIHSAPEVGPAVPALAPSGRAVAALLLAMAATWALRRGDVR